MFLNYDLHTVFSPVNVKNLKQLLLETKYDKTKSKFLIDGFTHGFDIGYCGESKVQMKSKNLKFTIGDETELWNKVMKEVQLKRYAGPYRDVPFKHFIQSPIGLVPKDHGTKTRLIFHLSYPRNTEEPKSVKSNTPPELSSVQYPSFDDAVKLCLEAGVHAAIGKSDMSSAFRHLGIRKQDWKYLVMKAKNPMDGKFYYFVDKCLPFGASISCSHFQAFSDAISHIVKFKTGYPNINYLDDYFFAARIKMICDSQIQCFLDVCKHINFPVAKEKTFWGMTRLTFLGLLIDTAQQRIGIPDDKLVQACTLINNMLRKKSKKTTLQKLQQLCSFLNFLGKCVVPGRAFTRQLYAHRSYLTNKYHHLKIKREM